MALYIYPPTPVSVVVPPVAFIYDGAPTDVEQDTANPANNKPLPTGVYFIKDGIPTPVLEDTVTPANNEPLPVKLTGVTGDVIINAGDLNVSTSATNDSMAIGDGVTGQLAKVDLNDDAATYALKVKDNDANTKLSTIQADTTALSNTTGDAGSPIALGGISVHGSDGTNFRKLRTDANGELQVDVLSSALPSGAATLAEQQAQTTIVNQISQDTTVLASAVNSDGNPAGSTGVMIGGKDGAGDFQQASVNAAGELSVTFGSAGFATETTLSTLNNKVANDYGASSGAVRTAAQVGNATGQADFNAGATGAQTLRANVNIKREGNDLSYNSGAADANTLRSVLATRHEAAGTPIATRLSDGATFIGEASLVGNSQKIVSTNGQTLKVAAFALGFDSVNAVHKEILLDSTGRVITSPQSRTLDSVAQRTTSGTIVAPSGAKGFTIQNSARAGGALRFSTSGASATVGYLLEAGQSTSYQEGASNLSIFDVDGLGIDCAVLWYV